MLGAPARAESQETGVSTAQRHCEVAQAPDPEVRAGLPSLNGDNLWQWPHVGPEMTSEKVSTGGGRVSWSYSEGGLQDSSVKDEPD